jgi:hypothetical protein
MKLENVNKEQLITYLKEDGDDGWTIWDPSKFTEMGFELADLPVQAHESDTSDPKSTIFKDGKIVKKLVGVYNLTFLHRLAIAVGADTSTGKFGRGSQARELTGRILEVLTQ